LKRLDQLQVAGTQISDLLHGRPLNIVEKGNQVPCGVLR
jgi:hypothetical protein